MWKLSATASDHHHTVLRGKCSSYSVKHTATVGTYVGVEYKSSTRPGVLSEIDDARSFACYIIC